MHRPEQCPKHRAERVLPYGRGRAFEFIAWHGTCLVKKQRINGDPVSSQHIAVQDSGPSRASMGNGVP
jgi:hypothetical protein